MVHQLRVDWDVFPILMFTVNPKGTSSNLNESENGMELRRDRKGVTKNN